MENEIINGFVVKYKLGDGGMAEVWYAENSIQKPAAIKILKKQFCEEKEIVERFQNEGRMMVQLNHPNIRSILSYELLDNRPALVMEYLEGADLAVRMKRGEAFSFLQVSGWWNDLVDALQYTHRKGIVHRDIKPSNLFITEDGKIKLLDFGVAKLKDNITVTQTGSRMGTLMYMSPEQVLDSKNLNYKTDIYSLAVTFFHLVTHQPPYDNTRISDFEIQESIVRKPIDILNLSDPWRTLLPDFFIKNPEERKELRRVFDTHPKNIEDTFISKVPEINVQPVFSKPVETPVYQVAEKKRKGSVLLPMLVIIGLIFFILNKDRVAAFFKTKKEDKPVAVQPILKETPKPVILPEVTDTIAVKPDTIISKGEDENMDQVIVNSGISSNKEESIKAEIADYYLYRKDCNSLSKFFEEVVVQYYNKSNVPLSEVKKECETYHGKWQFTSATINNDSYVFTLNQNGKYYVDFNMLYKIKQKEEDDWIMYSIDVAVVINENNKFERIVETRIEKL